MQMLVITIDERSIMKLKDYIEQRLKVKLEESLVPFIDEAKSTLAFNIDSGDEPYDNWSVYKCTGGYIFKALDHIGQEFVKRFIVTL